MLVRALVALVGLALAAASPASHDRRQASCVQTCQTGFDTFQSCQQSGGFSRQSSQRDACCNVNFNRLVDCATCSEQAGNNARAEQAFSTRNDISNACADIATTSSTTQTSSMQTSSAATSSVPRTSGGSLSSGGSTAPTTRRTVTMTMTMPYSTIVNKPATQTYATSTVQNYKPPNSGAAQLSVGYAAIAAITLGALLGAAAVLP